jgi:polysaccharide deacetylase
MISSSTRLRRSFDKTIPFFAAVAGGRAPAFVYGGRVQEIPVFTYHMPGPRFEEDLRVLQRAGYRTAGAEELAAYAVGTDRPDGRTVALTFDDGLESLVRVVVPLLQQYQFRGIAFVVAGLVPERSKDGLAGWAELRAAVATGVIEVGSHSLYHHQVPVSPDVVGVVDSGTDTGFTANVPIPRFRNEDPVLGTPIYRGRPRYTASPGFLPDPEGLERCRSFVRERGEEVFRQPSGLREIRKLASRAGRYESGPEADAAVEADMRASFERLAAECPNAADDQLCFPWYARTARADRLAARAGASLLFGGFDPSRLGPARDRPPLLQRLFADLLRRLPGPDRVSLGHILRARASAHLFPTGTREERENSAETRDRWRIG